MFHTRQCSRTGTSPPVFWIISKIPTFLKGDGSLPLSRWCSRRIQSLTDMVWVTNWIWPPLSHESKESKQADMATTCASKCSWFANMCNCMRLLHMYLGQTKARWEGGVIRESRWGRSSLAAHIGKRSKELSICNLSSDLILENNDSAIFLQK